MTRNNRAGLLAGQLSCEAEEGRCPGLPDPAQAGEESSPD